MMLSIRDTCLISHKTNKFEVPRRIYVNVYYK